jgi:hypothetical protein
MTLNLIADQIVNGKIYPALAQHQALPHTQAWREFGQHWPYTIPVRLQEYCDYHAVELNVLSMNDHWPNEAFYPIGIGFFDFAIDYFALLPDRVMTELRKLHIRILFYYHEGDNPHVINQRLDVLCDQHNLHKDCYIFVSSNSAAKNIPRFVCFQDSELWYWQRNHSSPALKIHHEPRERDFTVLNRLHKSWRALGMADLKHNGILDNSYWSYCESGEFMDTDCPIEIDSISGLRTRTEKFLQCAPYESDDLDNNQRNNHSTLVPKYHVNSYCNIVMETHFDIGSGVLLSEKTFKPIKHGQMFFVAGAAGSLQILRELGYRVFDGILDNSYDLEINATQRWMALTRSIFFAQLDLPQLFELCRADIEHNQQLFQATKTDRLNTLIKEINERY